MGQRAVVAADVSGGCPAWRDVPAWMPTQLPAAAAQMLLGQSWPAVLVPLVLLLPGLASAALLLTGLLIGHDHTSTQRCGQLHLLPPGLLACWPVMKRAGVLPAGVTVPGIYTRPLTVHRCCCTAACSPELQLHCLEQHAVLWQLAVEGSGQHSRRYS
ncbi:hypothetical protein COO60DRAFT_1473214 [Scenedesmus sp. NREL 46B-D3]|nr:hypothetical protein COO60DRAFT_1473214 [Scenedesmus sp. NREL 46B-D3]